MPDPPKNYAVTDLADRSVILILGGEEFPVTAFSASFALNEIPQAQCYLAVGRAVASQDAAAAATIHTAPSFPQMTPALVFVSPTGEYDPSGQLWPGYQVAFRGYFVGFASRKVHDKFVVVANLVHWLADLACSSTLTRNGHVGNPTQLNAAAAFDTDDSAGAGQGTMISMLANSKRATAQVPNDVWGAIRDLFCGLANRKTQPCGPASGCGGSESYVKNDRALKALSRIEGTAEDDRCAFVMPEGEFAAYSVPLKLDTGTADDPGPGGSELIENAVAQAIGQESIESYSAMSFWDVLIARYCPLFGMAVVPMVERALVIADLPAYRGAKVWKTIVDEYSSLQFNGALERPQRGVGVISSWASQTGAGIEEDGSGTAASFPVIGGCYTEASVDPDDGMIQFVEAPSWLQAVPAAGAYAGVTSGIEIDAPARAAGADAPGAAPAGTPETLGTELNAVYNRYAQLVYVNNMLRGRSGSLAGKLRFDIAPGSIVKIQARPEAFLKGTKDGLAMTLIGCVSRVSVAIDAESGSAATSFTLTHMRTEEENAVDRTSVARHPLFGTAIHGDGKHGAPLIPLYNL